VTSNTIFVLNLIVMLLIDLKVCNCMEFVRKRVEFNVSALTKI